MIRTGALAAALAAGSIAAVLPAHGQDHAATLKFTSTQGPRDEHQLDARPKGPSAGDRWLLSSTLHRNGRVAGRLEGDCTGIDESYEVMTCSLVVILPDGRLTLQGASVAKRIPGVGGAGEEYAVTGGTGKYVRATGTMRRKSGRNRDTLTFTLGS
jgi:hypothetical protein